ncbi:MAG TPA: hypothetical protein VKQ73_00650, partial [Stellaceae bacterium]|nr:hypothetical protein [Stellaceae bacterium]
PFPAHLPRERVVPPAPTSIVSSVELRGLGSKPPLEQDRLILIAECDIEGNAGQARHGNFELNGYDLIFIEPCPHFGHCLGERDFGLFYAGCKKRF